MATVTIYHNPRCSKSRATLQIVQDAGAELEIVEYMNDAPTAQRLSELSRKLGRPALKMMRTKEARFAELGLSTSDDRSEDEWFRIMSENPVLIERPIVEVGERAAVGRPPEAVREIL